MEADQPDFAVPETTFDTERQDMPVDLPFARNESSHEVSIPLRSLKDNLSPIERFDLQPEHHLHRSEGFVYETDEAGHIEQNPSFEYGQEFYREQEPESAPETAEEEVAVAMGQLAGGASGSVDVPAAGDDSASSSSNPLRQLVNRISSMMRDSQQLLGGGASLIFDLLLWAIVIIIYAAIIAALRS